jgi:membrane dipeptidase
MPTSVPRALACLTIRIFDGHNDVLLALHEAGGKRDGDGLTAADRAFAAGGGSTLLDVPRAREGGLAGGLFAIFPADPPEDGAYAEPAPHERALADTLAMAARLHRLERAGVLRVVHDGAELDAAVADGALAAMLHLEGAEPIGPGLDELEVLHAAGLRSLGLTWSRPNRFATGVPFEFPGDSDQGPGLTDEGRALVGACVELGVLVDCAHLNARGFWDVVELTDGPLVVSHSNAHALCPSPRNLTDDQLRAVGERGGVVGLNFHVGFLRADGAEDPDTPVATLVAHAAHIAEVAGVDALVLGSDIDGATMPNELSDVSRLPVLFDALRAAGFAEPDLERVAWGNWRRVIGG